MRWCHYSHKGMGMGIHCSVFCFCVYKVSVLELFLWTKIHHRVVLFENLPSSSSRSEGSGALVLDLSGVSMLSLLKDRRPSNWFGR